MWKAEPGAPLSLHSLRQQASKAQVTQSWERWRLCAWKKEFLLHLPSLLKPDHRRDMEHAQVPLQLLINSFFPVTPHSSVQTPCKETQEPELSSTCPPGSHPCLGLLAQHSQRTHQLWRTGNNARPEFWCGQAQRSGDWKLPRRKENHCWQRPWYNGRTTTAAS